MRIGLVIVTYNSATLIERALQAIAAQTRRPDKVVVVDNESSDGTLEVVRRAASVFPVPVDVVTAGGNIGFAAANNLAVQRLSDCDLIALMNPDVFPSTTWLAALEAAASAHPEAASFATRLMMDDAPDRLDGAGDVCHVSGLAWRWGPGQAIADAPLALESRAVFSACAGAALYRRDDWVAVGGFDERFFCYMEDVDLGFRLQAQGRTCWYVADAVARHVGSASSGAGAPFAVYHGHRNLEWVFAKNMPASLMLRYAVSHLVMCTAALAWLTIQGHAWTFLRAKWHAIVRLPEFARDRQRHRIPASRLLPMLSRESLLKRLGSRLGPA